MNITNNILEPSSIEREEVKCGYTLDIHFYPVEDKVEKHYDLKLSHQDGEVTELIFAVDPSIGVGPYELLRRKYYEDLDENTDKKALDIGDVTVVWYNDSILLDFSGDRLTGKYTVKKEDGEFIMCKDIVVWDSLAQDTDPEELHIWIQVNKLDVPGREIHGDIFSTKGKEATILGVFSDDIIKELLKMYSNGQRIFLLRLYRGYVTQVIQSD